MNQAEEDLMVLSAQAGNERAFEFLFRRYHGPLVRFAARMARDPQLAQDAVQDAWLRIARRLGRLDDPRAFRSWIFRAVRWQVLDHLRKRTGREQALDETSIEANDPPPESAAGSQRLTALIAGLPDLERQALHLFYLDEMKIREIAVVLEIPGGTVKSRLNRARNRLREQAEQGDMT